MGKEAEEVAALTRELNSNAGNQFEITRAFFGLWHYVLECADLRLGEPLGVSLRHIEDLKNMIGYIKKNFADKLTLESIAAAGNMSKSSCNNVFKKYTGHAPNEYLIRYRLDRAMELLSTTDETVGAISGQCGFSSSSYMTEQFVRCYNMTPREFKNNRRR